MSKKLLIGAAVFLGSTAAWLAVFWLGASFVAMEWQNAFSSDTDWRVGRVIALGAGVWTTIVLGMWKIQKGDA
jgi:hypothetical protein